MFNETVAADIRAAAKSGDYKTAFDRLMDALGGISVQDDTAQLADHAARIAALEGAAP